MHWHTNSCFIIPRDTIAGRTLVSVIAIMTFLASITLGVVTMVSDSASQWNNDIAREITIQIRPMEGVDIDKSLENARQIALSFEGVNSAKLINDEDTARLLEPWLGSGLQLNDLPIPRLITVLIAKDSAPDFSAMRERLKAEIPGLSLDDHRAWVNQLTIMAYSSVLFGILVFILMMLATGLTVVFATQGAMATNRHIIEVLHIIGAKNRFIAHEFQKHFLVLGLTGASMGTVAAIFLLIGLAIWSTYGANTLQHNQMDALFGTFIVGFNGYISIIIVAALIGFLPSLTSRITVFHYLRSKM